MTETHKSRERANRRLRIALAVLAPIQLIALVHTLAGPTAHGPASEQAIALPAPSLAPATLLAMEVPAGFDAVSEHPLTLSDSTSHAADPKAASDLLQRLGFRQAYARTWLNHGTHQFVIAAVSEFRTPAGAAARKSGVAKSWTITKRARVPLSGITGAAASVYQPATVPGNLPQSGYSAEFRVERWEFNIIVGTNLGAVGSVTSTPELLQDVVTRELAVLQTHLKRYFPPPLHGDALVLRDNICHCSLRAPKTWEPIALDPSLAKAAVSAAARKAVPKVIFAAADTAADGTTLFALFRYPTRAGAHAAVQQAANKSTPAPRVLTLHLPVGKAYQFARSPNSVDLGPNARETTTGFEHAGWTYVAIELTVQPSVDQAMLDTILRSVKIES